MYLHRMITSEENGQLGRSGDGTYCNPVLPSDYSDIDCIRVGMIIMLFLLPFNIPQVCDHTFQGFGELEYHWCGITLCRTSHKR